jgi:replicative DNA helicase
VGVMDASDGSRGSGTGSKVRFVKQPDTKNLPHNWETERAVLGGVLLAPERLLEVREVLKAEHFHRPAHQHLFQLICDLADRGAVPDVTIALDEVERRGEAERVGGIAYVVSLPQACASVDNVETYARRVVDYAVRRRLALAAMEIQESIQEGAKEVQELLDGAERSVFEISNLSGPRDWHPLSGVLDEQIMEIQRRASMPGEVTGIPTGFIDLDKKLAGLQKTDLIILAARPAMGKTAFALNLALSAALQGGVAVGIFSLEMSRHQLATRMLCSQARVDAGKVRTGNLDPNEDWRRLTEASEALHALPILIDDTPGLTITQLRSKARRLKAEYPNLGLIVIDYLQLMVGTGGAKESRENVISNISRGLKILAKELQIPVIALSQLNRSLESRTDKRPLPSDLRESGAIEQDADIILFIYRDEVYNADSPKKGVAEIIIAKQRSGPIGTVELAFRGEFVLFQNLAATNDYF